MKITDALNAEIMNVLLGVSAGLIILWLVTDIMLKTFMHEKKSNVTLLRVSQPGWPPFRAL